MKLLQNSKTLRYLALLAAIVFCPFSIAETQFVTDVLYVPVRSGQGDDYRIVHKGLKSGTAVKVIDANEDSGFSFIETPEGVQGWIRTRYLDTTPTARIELETLRQQLGSRESEKKELEEKLINASSLEQQLTQSRQEYEELKQLSGNVVTINERNKALTEQNQLLQTEIDSLEAANEQLLENNSLTMMLYGALIVILTLVLQVTFDGIKRKRSYRSW
jgi:SH3 domain protein